MTMAVVAPDCTTDVPAAPVVLVATGNWWALAARIAIALARNGWTITAACPPDCPLSYVKAVQAVPLAASFAMPLIKREHDPIVHQSYVAQDTQDKRVKTPANRPKNGGGS